MNTFLSDSVVIARRNLIKIKRIPELLLFTTFQPIMFILLFGFVFGAAIDIPGSSYREFLIAGIFAQTVVFGSTITGTALAEDMQKGIIDRFRTLPMSEPAVLAGRTFSDLLNNVLVLIVMALTGLVIGWRVRTSLGEALLGFVLLLVFAYSLSWVMAYVGLRVRSVEIVGNASFIVIFPLTFIANTFVQSEQLPTPLRIFAEWNPVSSVTQAARELFGNIPPGAPEPSTWALQNPIIYTLMWAVAAVAVFAPLALRQYRGAVSR